MTQKARCIGIKARNALVKYFLVHK
jgi:hypothetical protein